MTPAQREAAEQQAAQEQTDREQAAEDQRQQERAEQDQRQQEPAEQAAPEERTAEPAATVPPAQVGAGEQAQDDVEEPAEAVEDSDDTEDSGAEDAGDANPDEGRQSADPAGPALDVFAALGIDPQETQEAESTSTPAVIDLDIPERDRKDPQGRGTQTRSRDQDEAPAQDEEPEEPKRGRSRSRRARPASDAASPDRTPPSEESAAQERAGDDDNEQDEDAESPRLPATALLFQAPDPTRARRPRRAAAPAGPPVGGNGPDGSAEDSATEGSSADRDESDATAGTTADSASDDAGRMPDADTGSDDGSEGAEDEDGQGSKRRRRRRGGRGRRRGGGKRNGQGEESASEGAGKSESGRGTDDQASESDGESAAAKKSSGDGDSADNGDNGDNGSNGGGSSRRRRRRRGSRGSDDSSRDEVTALKGSTRLEAKRQRRRDGRDSQRRRAIITEAEFLARRESVKRDMVVRERNGRTQVAVLEDEILVEHYVARKSQTSMVGNVHLGRVQNVLPSMEAAFIDIGKGRNAVLYAGEVNWDAAGLEGQPRRIEQALAPGDTVLVQVTKDPMGHKGARLTSQITLAGRYLVLVPSGAMTGISRKLPDTERNRLKKLLKDIVPDGQGVIVRTAAEGATEEELRRDVERLTRQWADIQKKANRKSVSAPTLLKGEPELAVRVVRDVFNEDFSSLTISGEEAWKTISEYVEAVAPDLRDRVYHWTEKKDLFSELRIDEQIAKALDRKVWLPSGGSLVIDRTEAMTVVDVNTGKFTGTGGTLEETVTRNNLEAAEEIVRQLRLRDIGGIIVIDFIDMVLEANRDLVLRRLVECLGRDRTRHQVAEVTSLGLVQMTRKRIGQGLLEAFSENCEHCNGRGYLVHTEPLESDDRGKRGGKSKGGGRTEPEQDEAQRAQVRAALANIAAAAANAHAEQDAKDARSAQSGPESSDAQTDPDGGADKPAATSGGAERQEEKADGETQAADGEAQAADGEPQAGDGTPPAGSTGESTPEQDRQGPETASEPADQTGDHGPASDRDQDPGEPAPAPEATPAAASAAQPDGDGSRPDGDGSRADGEGSQPDSDDSQADGEESQAEPEAGETAQVGTGQG